MKFLKYLIAIVIVLAIIAAVLNYKRETIARNIANSALRGKGLVATDLSIDTLGTEYVVLSRLTLEQDSGTRYELRGIRFPLSFPSPKAETITIDELHVVPAAGSGEPVNIAAALGIFLQLPKSVPNTEVLLGRLSSDGLPAVRNIDWRSDGDNQKLAFSLETAVVNLELIPDGLDRHRATVEVATGNDPDALHLPLVIERRETGYAVKSDATIHLRPWLPVLHSLGVVPEGLVVLDAILEGPLEVQFYDDSAKPIAMSADFSIRGERVASYEISADDLIALQIAEGASIKLGMTYPDGEWAVQIEYADFLLNSRLAKEAKGRIRELSCHRGVECQTILAFDDVVTDLAGDDNVTATFVSLVSIKLGEVTQIEFLPDTSLHLTDLTIGSAKVSELSIYRVAGAQLTIDDGGWNADIASAALSIHASIAGEALLVSSPATVRSFRVREAGSRINFAYSILAGEAFVRWSGAKIPALGVSGLANLANGSISTAIDVVDDAGSLSAKLTVNHQLSTGIGSVAVREATLRLDRRSLSAWRQDWPYAWDVVAGDWSAAADLAWQPGPDESILRGTLSQRAEGLAGNYEDIAFAGLNTSLAATLEADGSIQVEPTTVNLALIDVGIPIENLSANVEPDAANRQVTVRDLQMAALGGKIIADPFVYAPQRSANNVVLHPESIQLQFMVDLAEFDDIELTGSMSGRIPVTIGDEAITVTDGRLESDAPGGVIRYRSAAISAGGNSGINVVSKALGNFQYDSLTSDVNYTEAGDLKLKMRLSGINPDMDPLQPVILNLGIENNIPQLLRSLQATREIEDVLKRRKTN